MDTTTSEMQECIQACLDCHAICLREAMNHCLTQGGKHTEPTHFRLMLNCAELCQTSANFMLSHSDWHSDLCALCADVCDACARSCEEVGEMDECVAACRACSESCRQMAA